MLSFLAPLFAIAGLAAAAGPVIIHLLNRRRFRIIEWAAMDFLREAIHRSRRILQIRDLLLMALRMLCLALFGLALARPFTSRDTNLADPDQPVHAVVLVDNSLSMGYQKLDGTLLDEAKGKVKEVLERLPRGSRISIVPTCSPASEFTLEAYFTPEEAMEAVNRIKPLDRQAKADPTIDLALEACNRLPTMTAKQIYLFSDQHVNSWPGEAVAEHLKQLPSQLQVVQVTADGFENAWIADFKLRDGIADQQSPGVFVATVAYDGPVARHDVQVTLSIEGVIVATQNLDVLEPGQAREVQFPPYRFETAAEPGKPALITAEVAIPHDRLAVDDHRFLVVPVMAAVPVVFVDQYGQEEDARRNILGETYYLRRLLAPLTSRTADLRQLIQIRHLKIDQLSRESLADARLVVIAGVSNPRGVVPLLREYVEQGGNLVVAAGGEFDPASWTEAAWADGLGILPAPLAAAPVGKTPEETVGQLEPLHLDFDSLVNQFFILEGAAEEELKDLYALPYFFKIVSADVGSQTQDAAITALAEQIKQQQTQLAELDKKLAAATQREAKAAPAARAEAETQRAELEQQRTAIRPNWLLWRTGVEDTQESPEQAAERSRAKVLGKYNKEGLPFMVERRLGFGRVLMVTTGVSAGQFGWNTLALTNTMLVFDRIMRTMILDTLPPRNLGTEQQVTLPVPASERNARFTMVDADGQEQPLTVDALGGDRYGITLRNWLHRGVYRVTASRGKDAASDGHEAKLWEVAVAVNGPAEESRYQMTAKEDDPRKKSNQPNFLEATQASAMSIIQLQGRELWHWAMIAVLVGLLAEIALVAWTYTGGERTT